MRWWSYAGNPERDTNMTTESSGLASERHDRVLWLAFDRPHAGNAVNAAVAEALASALSQAARDPATAAVVLTGTGGRIFSAGIDVKNPHGLAHAALAASRRGAVERCLEAILAFDKPLVAAVNGFAIGLGFMLALLTDRVIAVDSAAFSLPEIDINIPTFLGISIVARAGGAALARDLVLSGRRMDAAEARERALVATVVSLEDLAATAQAAAVALAAKPQAAYALDKQWLARGFREEFAAANARSAEIQELLASGK
jgi:enoyl-CoA hydratase/carnithine racemase